MAANQVPHLTHSHGIAKNGKRKQVVHKKDPIVREKEAVPVWADLGVLHVGAANDHEKNNDAD
jgi:hypothetical protein